MKIITRFSDNYFQLIWNTVTLLFVLFLQVNLGYFHKDLPETTGVKLYADYKNFGEFVFYLRCLLDGAWEESLAKDGAPLADAVCYCIQELMRILSSVVIRAVRCAIEEFHLSCLDINIIPKTWYCPRCRALLEFKKRGSKQHSANTKPKLTHVTTHTNQTVTRHNTHQANSHAHVSTNTSPTVTHVTTKNNQIVSHVTRNTNKTVTKPTVSSNTEGVTILKPITN